MTDDMYLRIKQVTAVAGLSRATIYNMMAAGTFPMRTALGARAVGWLASELQTWMDERKLVEKRGVEAKPARRKGIPGNASLEKVSQTAPVLLVTAKAEAAVSKYADWIDDSPPPTATEKLAISERLRLINAMRRAKSKKTPSIRVRGKTGLDSLTSHRLTSIAVRPNIDGAPLSQKPFKRKI